MKKTALVITLVVAGLLTAAFFARKRLFLRVLPKIEKISAGSIAITNDTAHISLGLVLRNRGWVTYDLRSVDLRLTNDTLQLIHYVSDDRHVLTNDETKTIPLAFDLPIRDVIHRIRSLQGQADSTVLVLHGWLSFSTWVGDVRVEVNERFPVEVPVPPQITVTGLEYLAGTTRKSADGEGRVHNLRLHAKVVNLDDKKFEFHDIKYDFYGDKLIESHGKLGDIVIDPFDSFNITIPLQLTVESDMKLIYRVLTDNDVINYRLQMHGTIAALAGIRQEIPASLSTGGRAELLNPDRKHHVPLIIRRKNGRKK